LRDFLLSFTIKSRNITRTILLLSCSCDAATQLSVDARRRWGFVLSAIVLDQCAFFDRKMNEKEELKIAKYESQQPGLMMPTIPPALTFKAVPHPYKRWNLMRQSDDKTKHARNKSTSTVILEWQDGTRSAIANSRSG
jgi:hypothetical protein